MSPESEEWLLEHPRQRTHILRGILIIAGLAIICAFTAAYFALRAQNDAAQSNAEFVQQIQKERANAILRSCRDQNRRNVNTKRQLQIEINKLPPVQRARAKKNAGGTEALIDSLAPNQNCEALVKRAVNTHR